MAWVAVKIPLEFSPFDSSSLSMQAPSFRVVKMFYFHFVTRVLIRKEEIQGMTYISSCDKYLLSAYCKSCPVLGAGTQTDGRRWWLLLDFSVLAGQRATETNQGPHTFHHITGMGTSGKEKDNMFTCTLYWHL